MHERAKILISIAAALSLSLLSAAPSDAQDVTPPVIELRSNAVLQNGKIFDFIFSVEASDDAGLRGLEFRGKVDGRPLDDWMPFPYLPDSPIVIGVQCSTFRFDIRSVDLAGNVSNTITRVFRAPFTGPNSGLVTKAPQIAFVPGAPVADPPAVIVRDNDAIIVLKSFAVPGRKRVRALELAATKRPKKPAAKPTIRYSVSLTDPSSNSRRILSKKNALTVNNLAPGAYTTNYRVQLVRGRKILGETLDSPSATFVVPG